MNELLGYLKKILFVNDAAPEMQSAFKKWKMMEAIINIYTNYAALKLSTETLKYLILQTHIHENIARSPNGIPFCFFIFSWIKSFYEK